MKTFLKIFLGLSLVSGAAYATFRFTPLGKSTLSRWLLDRWSQIVPESSFDRESLQKELERLDYPDLELLVRYTWFNPLEREEKDSLSSSEMKRFDQFMARIKAREILTRANFSALENSVFPG